MKIFLPLITLMTLIILSCDSTNFLAPLADKSSDEYLLEEAKIKIDKAQYAEAIALLAKMKKATNERSITLAAATLGEAGLGILDVIKESFGTDSKDGVGGTDGFLDTIDVTSVFGSGVTKSKRISALNSAIAIVAAAPEPNDSTKNLACILAGLLAAPTIVDGKSSIAAATTNLETILAKAEGAGSSADECPGIDEFEQNLTTISEVQISITSVLDSIRECSILDFSGSDLNAIEEAVKSLNDNADQGCESVKCEGPLCDALSLGCISSLIDTSDNPQAGDGKLATCEILQNCLDPSSSCF